MNFRRFVLPLFTAFCLVLPGACIAAPTGSILDRKLVWAHSMMCFPLDLKDIIPYHPDTGVETYGANYPLEQELGLAARTGESWVAADIRDAKAAGFDGFFVDVFTGTCGHYFAAADKVGGFLISPCIDMSMVPSDKLEDTAVATLIANCRIAAQHPSAAKVGDAYVVWDYGTEQAPAATWTRIQKRVADAGYKLYFVGAVNGDGDLTTKKALPPTVAAFAPVFDAGYSFGNPGMWFEDVAKIYAAARRPYFGGLSPGYYRIGGGFKDADGTAGYRREWHRQLAANLPWLSMSTWNDLAENTHVLPAADFNDTRSDVNAWFAAKYKATPLGWGGPRLYVTTPKTIYPGQTYVAEALALNAGKHDVTVSVSLVDGTGKPFGAPVAATVKPGDDGAAVASIACPSPPPGRFLRAVATLNAGGKTVATVTGAPIVWLDPVAQPGLVTLYYSIPARNALPGRVGLNIADGKAAIATPTVPNIKYVDLLHNTDLARDFFATPPYEMPVPRRDRSGALLGRTEWGYYVARVTDAQRRVAYSDPVYVAPPADIRVTENYAFDEGGGTSTRDSSNYKRIGDLVRATWLAPQDGGPGIALNGTDSRINLPLSQGPDGPMAFTVNVRPHAYGGMIYCDSGGMWLTLGANGEPILVRLGPTGWTTLTGKATVPINQWSTLRCEWDGKALRILVNGKPVGETPCGDRFRGGRRAIGCNPFGSSSAYWTGDIRSFRMELLDGTGG